MELGQVFSLYLFARWRFYILLDLVLFNFEFYWRQLVGWSACQLLLGRYQSDESLRKSNFISISS